MNELIERVARAIYERDYGAGYGASPTLKPWPELFNEEACHYRGLASVAIEAMRELPSDPGPRYDAGEYSRRTQAAMVDEALGT